MKFFKIFYFIDYMDFDLGNVFGGVCNKWVEDVCVYLSSYLDLFGFLDYSSNVDCMMVFDVGKMVGVKFKFEW